MKLRISKMAATDARRPGKRKVIMINDGARAPFEAPTQRKVCIELPLEEHKPGENFAGLLQMSYK